MKSESPSACRTGEIHFISGFYFTFLTPVFAWISAIAAF